MTTFLADKSALTRRAIRDTVRAAIEPLILAGRIATCAIIDLELLYSAPSKKTYFQIAEALHGMPRVPVNELVVERALQVQALLAAKSQHRAVSLHDLIIAACAEVHGLTVLHYDADFDRIAKVTRQRTQWVVPRGSVS